MWVSIFLEEGMNPQMMFPFLLERRGIVGTTNQNNHVVENHGKGSTVSVCLSLSRSEKS